MKILQIIHGYPPEYNAGSEVYTQSVCNEMIRHHEVVLFSREENEYLPDYEIRETITAHRVQHFIVNMARAKDGYNHSILNRKFEGLIKHLKPDIAHIGHLNHLSTGIVDVLHRLKIPVIYTLHDFWLMCPRGQFLQRPIGSNETHPLCDGQQNTKCAEKCYKMYFGSGDDADDLQSWSRWIKTRMDAVRDLCDNVDLFIAPSMHIRNRFINEFGIQESRIRYLDYGFPLHYLTPVDKTVEKEAFCFGYIGTHIPAKGVNILIKAFSGIRENAELLIWGRMNGQSSHSLVDMARKCPCKVRFMGEYVNSDLGKEVFAKINCIVVPSIWDENSPLVIHEAQACKIPVITADAGGMAEYVHDHVNGLLFKHRDETDLSEKLKYAMNHPEVMKKLGLRGYLLSDEGRVPDIQNHCESLINIYKDIIKTKHENKILADHA